MRPHFLVDRYGEFGQRAHVDLHVEVARVGQDRAVAHDGEVLGIDDVDRAGGGDEDLAERRGLGHRQHAEAAQRRVKRPHRVHLGDDDLGAEAAGAFGHPAAAGAEPGHHHGLARQQRVGGPQDAVDRRLPRPAGVVHHPLGRGVVGRDHRERERALGGHPAEPDHARGGRLAAAFDLREQRRGPRVQRVDQIAAVVDDQVRLVPGPGPARCGGSSFCGRPRRGRRPRCRGLMARAAAMSSWVDSGLEAASETAAPPACSNRTSIAVSAVTCRQAAMLSPSKGRSLANRLMQRGQERHGPFGVSDAGLALGGEARVGDVSNGSAPACTGRRR